jgi:hypothetical protein
MTIGGVITAMVMSPKRKRIPPKRVYVSFMVVKARQGKVMDDKVACCMHFDALLDFCVLSYDGPVGYGSGARRHVVRWWRFATGAWQRAALPAVPSRKPVVGALARLSAHEGPLPKRPLGMERAAGSDTRVGEVLTAKPAPHRPGTAPAFSAQAPGALTFFV